MHLYDLSVDLEGGMFLQSFLSGLKANALNFVCKTKFQFRK